LSAIGDLDAPRFDLFLLGMFSMVDAILGVPMDRAVEDLPVSTGVRAALTHGEGQLGAVVTLVEALERAEWDRLEGISSKLGLDIDAIPPQYVDAMEWAGRVFAEARATLRLPDRGPLRAQWTSGGGSHCASNCSGSRAAPIT
jgi:EAL and modified HD-GYP domain-containing signal transduction protein